MAKIIYLVSLVLFLWVTNLEAMEFGFCCQRRGQRGLEFITQDDLVKDLANLKDNDYSVFGIGLPKRIILEVFEFGTKNNDEFSTFVKKYPYIQLIFSQWLTIKLYERHKELTKNNDLSYKEFLKTNFTAVFNDKTYNLYEAINKITTQEEFNYKDDPIDFTDIYSSIVAAYDQRITPYDIMYDFISNSIKKVFLKDEESLKVYLPLKQEDFIYKEVEYNNPKEVFEGLYHFYGKELPQGYKEKVPKEYYLLNALSLKNYSIDEGMLSIPKAKTNKLGIGYDELLELITKDESSLTYPEIYEFDLVDAPELDEYKIDEDGDKILIVSGMKVIPTTKHRANYEDIIKVSSQFYAGDAGFMPPPQYEIHTSEKVDKMIKKQYYEANALLFQNNFITSNVLFETLRKKERELKQKAKEGDEYAKEALEDFVLISLLDKITTPSWYGWIIIADIYFSFRFNQALALAFLNAYDRRDNGI